MSFRTGQRNDFGTQEYQMRFCKTYMRSDFSIYNKRYAKSF